ncbi:MAG TPA: Fe-S cluster assembly protein SufD [Candidatus Angelobacter sp.]|nr:Fe-S cluster assembly protein SufD [Candidatus Angelobacter sp.]
MIETKQRQDTATADPYSRQFERFVEPDAGKQPSWLFPLRKAGIARFAELGFPTLKDEDWRFTNVAPLAKLPFKPVFDSGVNGVTPETLSKFTFANLSGPRLVFVNGHFVKELSAIGAQPNGVRVLNLAAALTSDSGRLEQHLGRYVRIDAAAFAALNTAFFQDGAFIHVAAGVTVPEPIRLLFISTGRGPGATTHPRNLIIAEKQSRLTVIESYICTADTAYFTNGVTELVAGDDAVVEHLKFQDESLDAFHIATLHGQFGRHSRVNAHSFALGARLSRTNIHTDLAGEGLECVLNGLYLTKGEQLADHHMIVEHAQPRCASHEYFNGILEDKSRGVFHGRIYVHPVAQKTDAKQTNKNILLSDAAVVDTKPQLEIYADDVKCTHGATIGQLDEDSVYYLRSRGIGLDTARQMLIHAFAGEIIDRVKCEAAREELDKLIWERLEQNPHLAEKK